MRARNFESAFFVFLMAFLLCAHFSFAAVSKKKFSFEETGAETASQIEVVVDSVPVQESAHFCLTANFANLQKDLRENISQKISAMKNGSWATVWAFLLVCFIYGMLHALGPGHGKSIVVGYFLARKGRWRDGVFLGAGITFAHTLSAVLLLFVLYGILKTAAFPAFEMGRLGIEKASYGLVSLTGILLIGIAIHDFIRIFRKRKKIDGKENSEKLINVNKSSWKELLGVAAVTGIVPCPAVALIVLFCLLNSMAILALIAAAVICVGMTLTNVLFGIAAVAMKKGLDRGASKSQLASYIHIAASFVGGIIVFLAGLLMLSNL